MPGLLDYIPSQSDVQRTIADLLAKPRNRLRGLLSDPSGFLQSALSDVVPTDQQAQEQLARYRMPLSQDYAMGPSGYDNKMQDIALGALTVYHGSPHKFDKFDMSKIGSGEGAQAYGHGLYMAETPDVANTYKMSSLWSNTPADQLPYLVNGKAYKPSNIDEAQILHSMTKNDVEMLHSLESNYSRLANPSTKTGKHYQEMLSRLKELQGSKVEPGVGYLYKVDLPDESIAKMLDWDKPLSQQAPEVRAALESHQAYPAIKAWLNAHLSNAPKGTEATGQAINEVLAGKLGGQQAVSNLLKSQGIPGIRYLDGGSRNAGQGTYNYVVFDDTLPTILERNGQKLK